MGTGVQLTGRHAARDDTDRFTTVAQDTAGTAGPPAASEAAAVTPGDTAERWPADSGADPWTAHAAADSWPAADAVTGWAGNAAAEGTNGQNGSQELPGYGEAGGWPAAGDPVHADTAERHELDHDEAEFAETDSLPRRVRQASLAPQLRENTLHGRTAANGEDAASSGTVEERSPEEARSTITAIQQGWERGRSLFDPPEKTTDTMAASQPAAEPTPPEAGEAGPQGNE
jgi:hypothetical protein